MPRFDPTEFGRLLARLTPQELSQAEELVADARKRAEAVLEIDARGRCWRPGGVLPALWGRRAHPVEADQNRRTAMELLERRGRAAAARRWPGFTAPIWWSRWRMT